MSKSSDRGGGPGSMTNRGVRQTMSAPFNKASMGSQDTLGGPFNAPRTGGDNGLPTTISANLGRGTGVSRTPAPGVAAQGPSSQGPNRPGTVQDKY